MVRNINVLYPFIVLNFNALYENSVKAIGSFVILLNLFLSVFM